jgi:hypothetical protein
MAMSVYGSASSQNGKRHASRLNETGKALRPQNGLPLKQRLAPQSHPGPWVRGAVRARTTRFAIEGSTEPMLCCVVRTVSTCARRLSPKGKKDRVRRTDVPGSGAAKILWATA